MATYNPQFAAIAQAFVDHYYAQFDRAQDAQTRSNNVADLYDDNDSYLTFEGAQLKGKRDILNKFTQLSFKAIQRQVTKMDAQPLADGSILVQNFGQIRWDEDPIQSFIHTFVLRPSKTGSFFISNEVFRLVLHDIAA